MSTANPTAGPEPTWASVPQIAEQLHLPVTKVHQLIRDGQLLGIRRDGILRIPAEFVLDGLIVKGLPATLTLLRDNGYRDDEIIAWLFAVDESLPGSPVVALRENRGREVHRRAQVAGF
ncbi:Rv2175c family DNA-binding protein [Nakamurella sp.]|uniref:Rv2175c family DNA-binding protein n=1 Tax=Nakamurella sp. TaxID=1869182 RepID=UPI003B3AE4F4